MATVLSLVPAHSPDDERAALQLETPRLLAWSNGGAGGEIRFDLFEKSAQREIGWISLRASTDGGEIAELDCFVEASERGRGLSREALRAVIPAALERVRAQVLRVNVQIDSPAALAMARAIGLRPAGRTRGPVQRFEKDLCALL